MGHTQSTCPRVKTDRKPRFLLLIIFLLVLVRLWLGTMSGYSPDTAAYKEWSLRAGLSGVHTVFDAPNIHYDYPPLYAYLLVPFGWLYGTLGPAASKDFSGVRIFADSDIFSLLVKFPPLLFDVAIAVLLAWLVVHHEMWGHRRSWLGWLPALFYLSLPSVLFASGYWGQPDAVHSFFLLCSLTLILTGRFAKGWVCAGLACLMKPLAVPLLPILLLATVLRGGWRQLVRGCLVFIGTGAAFFLPFIFSGRGVLAFQRVIGDLNVMPFTSVNAHNLWWLIGPWRPADELLFGPFSASMIGQFFFVAIAGCILFLLWGIERSRIFNRDRNQESRVFDLLASQWYWYLGAAATLYAFFAFSTHMHENHAFAVIPFLVPLLGRLRFGPTLVLVVSISVAGNMFLHDLALGSPIFVSAAEPSYILNKIGCAISSPEFCLADLNALLTIVMCGLLFFLLYRHRKEVITG